MSTTIESKDSSNDFHKHAEKMNLCGYGVRLRPVYGKNSLKELGDTINFLGIRKVII